MLPFELPPPDGMIGSPRWTGTGFQIGETLAPVLEYSENFAGWSDDLTTLHEDAAGDSHPIDIASREDALAQLETNFRADSAPTILEIGCSSGFLLTAIRKRFPFAVVVGADVVREPLLKLARDIPSLPLIRFDLLKCPLPSESFDAIVMLNVLEHIEDDESALQQVSRLLKPGGIVVIEVPAGPQLYDGYDKALMHFRRYAMGELTLKLQACGLSLTRHSHLGFLIYPAFAFVKRRNQRADQREDSRRLVSRQAAGTSTSRLLRLAMRLERHLGSWFSFPVGIRCLAVGRKVTG